MSGFLEDYELRSLRLEAQQPFAPVGLALGEGSQGLEVAIVESDGRPRATDLRSVWKERKGRRAAPVLLVALYREKVALCGPDGDPTPVYRDLDRDQAERMCRAALEMPDRHAARRFLRSVLPEAESPIPGLKNQGLLATHELERGVPARPDWNTANAKARAVLDREGRKLLSGMGYGLEPMPGPGTLLVEQDGRHTAVAVFLEQGESIETAQPRFSNLSPVSWALAHADRRSLRWVVVSTGRMLRLYAVRPGAGVAARGRTETFIQVHLDLLKESEAAFLWLLFSPGALREGGTLEEILRSSLDYAADLGGRLRERIYDEVLPRLATAIAEARGLEDPNQEDLNRTYEMALFLLFRLLFLAYAEDQRLLPIDANETYRSRSLKEKAKELLRLVREDRDFDDQPTHWREIRSLFDAVRDGNREWDVPQYNGMLFSQDPEVSPVGSELAGIELSNREFGPALRYLLLDEGPEGLGPVDFRSLGVREFGTVYEGLLESELSKTDVALALGPEATYVPAEGGVEVKVPAGGYYVHDASGKRKSTGTYYTKKFAVEHLLDHALEPALERHLQRLDDLDDVEAAEAFFDFRVADIAMGSGHFLIAAVDHIERRLSEALEVRQIPGVKNELERLRIKAAEALGDPSAGDEIEDGQLLRRQIARRCIYGVDLNPTAVHLARLSLWIHTFVPGLPLSFLDHGLVRGNSLLGIGTLDEAREALGVVDEEAPALWDPAALELVDRAGAALERLGRLSDADAAEIQAAREAQREIEEREAPVAALFDILTATRLDADLRAQVASGAVLEWMENPEALLQSDIHERAVKSFGPLEPFHFPVRFPEVFREDRGGFDVIVGNPPWEKTQVEENEFWSRYLPGYKGLPQREQEKAKQEFRTNRPDLVDRLEEEREAAEVMREVLTSGAYPGMGASHPDLYKAFCWRFLELVREDEGWIGVVLPRSAFAARGSQEFRRSIFAEDRIDDLTLLLNNRQWVFEDVHPQYTVSLVSIRKNVPEEDRVLHLRGPYRSRAAYERGVERPPVRFVSEEVLEWTDTGALPLLPTEESAEVFARIREAPRLDLDDGESWRARPIQELNTTTDKALFDLEEERPSPDHWPVYKGESFDLWTPDTGTYYGWAEAGPVLDRLQEKREWGGNRRNSPFYEFPESFIEDRETLPAHRSRLAFRDVSRATDTRTVRVALIPPRVFLVHLAPTLLFPRGDCKDEAYLLGVMSSLVYDWYMRSFVETHLTFNTLNPSPVPRPDRSDIRWQRVVEIAGVLATPDERFGEWAEEVGVDIGPVSDEEQEGLIAELNAIVSSLYGLSELQVRHVFETFHEGWDPTERLEAVIDHFQDWKRTS